MQLQQRSVTPSISIKSVVLIPNSVANSVCKPESELIVAEEQKARAQQKKREFSEKRAEAKKLQQKPQNPFGGGGMPGMPGMSNDIELDKDAPVPTDPAQKEAFFMEQLAHGEQLFRQGPEFFDASAICFYRAMKVYPQPMDLLVIFQRSTPEEVFNKLMELMAADVRLMRDYKVLTWVRLKRSKMSTMITFQQRKPM